MGSFGILSRVLHEPACRRRDRAPLVTTRVFPSVVATLTLFARRCFFVMCANSRQSAFDSRSLLLTYPGTLFPYDPTRTVPGTSCTWYLMAYHVHVHVYSSNRIESNRIYLPHSNTIAVGALEGQSGLQRTKMAHQRVVMCSACEPRGSCFRL